MARTSKNFSASLSSQTRQLGLMYMLFSVFLLPILLQALNAALPRPMGNVWYNFLYFSCNFLAVLLIFRKAFSLALRQAGQHPIRFIAAVLSGAAAYALLSWLMTMLLQLLSKDYVNYNDSGVIAMLKSNFCVMFLGSVILVPVAEEALHRCLVFGWLYEKSPLAAYAVSMAVFSLVHLIGYLGVYSPLHFLMAFLQYLPAGLVLAWAYRFSGSLFAPILIHAAINAAGLFTMR